jgi:hypothetical protein
MDVCDDCLVTMWCRCDYLVEVTLHFVDGRIVFGDYLVSILVSDKSLTVETIQ